MTLEDLITFVLERLDQLTNDDYVIKWKARVKKANSFFKIILGE